MPLTDLEIRRAKPSEKTYTKADGNGLSLQIEPNGSKGWRFRYRFEGKAKMLSLGTYPKVTLPALRPTRLRPAIRMSPSKMTSRPTSVWWFVLLTEVLSGGTGILLPELVRD